MKWIKFITREITQEERDDFGGAADAFIWDSPVPEEDEEVLVSDGFDVWIDTWILDYVYHEGLENSDNVEDLYWMPLPELPMKYWIPSEETE